MTNIPLSDYMSGSFVGYTGSQGNLGYTGSIGYTGSQGVIGYSGSLGYTGSKGDIGYIVSTLSQITSQPANNGVQASITDTQSDGGSHSWSDIDVQISICDMQIG
jgi:hypothetical protein